MPSPQGKGSFRKSCFALALGLVAARLEPRGCSKSSSFYPSHEGGIGCSLQIALGMFLGAVAQICCAQEQKLFSAFFYERLPEVGFSKDCVVDPGGVSCRYRAQGTQQQIEPRKKV